MKRKSIVLLCIVISLIILKINIKESSAQGQVNLFDEILIQTKSQTVEYGLMASFKTTENPKEIFNRLINTLELNNEESKLTFCGNVSSCSVEFSGEDVEGYMEAIKDDDEDIIKININKRSNENGLVPLQNNVGKAIGYRDKDIKYFQFLKAKIQENNTNEFIESDYSINQRIIEILKNKGSKNIETVSINNGLSTLAYTKRFQQKVNNNKLIDFNYAVCNYSSGKYIIIGTPEIITTY